MANPIKYSELFDNLGPGSEELKDFTTAVQALSRNYKSFAKGLEGDGERVKAVIAALSVQAGTLKEQAVGINAANEKERAGMAALTAEATKLAQERQRLEAVLAAQAKAQRVVNDATKEAQSALRAMQNELREAYAAKDTARIDKAAASIRQYKTETAGLSAALRGTNSELTAARGSYDALVNENAKLTASLRGLEGGLNSGSSEALRLQKQIADNTQTLKNFDASILIFNRNVGNYAGSFESLIAELAKAKAAQAGLTAGSEEYNRQQIRVTGFQTAAQKSAAQMGLSYEQAEAKINGVAGAIQPLTTDLVRLEKEQQQLAKTTGEESVQYQKLGFQIQATKKQIDEVAVATSHAGEKQEGLTKQLGFTKDGLKDNLTQLAVGAIGFQALASATQAVVASNIAYSRELAEVRKTTGLTADEAERLAQSLKQLDTPTSLSGLLKIASVGGQLGVAKADLLDFTKAIDTAVQALGNDFTGGADEIATTLGKISSVFRQELGPDAAQNILAIGSAVNQISADGAATAPFLTDVALRVGAVAAQARVGLKNVLAYAAVLQETGFSAETSGTALNRFFSVLSTRTQEAYRIAKNANPALTLKDFTHLVNTDFNQAIQVFLAGLSAGGTSTTALSKELATLKLQSGEAKSAIITLAQNTDLYAERQRTANDQLRDATSLAAEAAINTDTLAGSYDKLTNGIKNFFTSGTGGSILKFFIDVARETAGAVAGTSGFNGEIVKAAERAKAVQADYTLTIVESTQAAVKQTAAQEQLLNSYTKLGNTAQRTAEQEVAYSGLRLKVLQEFGTTEAKTILDSIARRKEQVENTKNTLRLEIDAFGKGIDEAQAKFTRAQDAISVQLAGKTAEQIAAIRAAASARAEAAADGRTTSGASILPQAQINAADRLNKAEESLKNQQLLRAQAVAALAKLEGTNTQAKKDGAEAADAEAKAEEQLDRAAQERAKNRVSALRDELADNQARLEALRKYQAQQAQLFDDKQLSPEKFAESVRGSEDLAVQYERNGAALRLKIVRAESAEKLIEAENDRVRQSNKKNISEAELADIQGQYAARRVEIFRKEGRDIAQIQTDLRAKLEVKPLEFKVAGVDFNKLRADLLGYVKTYESESEAIRNAETARESELIGQLARREISQKQYEERASKNQVDAANKAVALDKKYHKATLDEQKNANEKALAEQKRATAERVKTIEKIGSYTQEAEAAFFAIKGNFIDADIQRTQEAYDHDLAAAGDNAALKTQIQTKYDKQLKKLNYDKAKAERDQAAISIAINTAVAIAKAFAEYPFPFALIPAGIALAEGLLQEAVVLSKPLPAYFKGRESGPAEFANLGEHGPELAGQPGSYRVYTKPSVGYLAAGDKVFTAPKTQEILRQNELVEGRLVQRAQQADLEQQTARLRSSAVAQQAAAQAAFDRSNGQVLHELKQINRSIAEQQQWRLSEDGLRKWTRRGDTWTEHVSQRYRHGR